MTWTLKIKAVIIAAATVLSATPALACFPAEPDAPLPSTAEIARSRIEGQRELWNSSTSVYLGRLVSAAWASEDGPGPRDMGVLVTLDGLVGIKGTMPPRQGVQMIVCDPQDSARDAWRPGALMIVYAHRFGLLEDWRRAGRWQVFEFIPVAENTDPRIGPALHEAAARLRSTRH